MKRISLLLALLMCTTLILCSCGHTRPADGYLQKSDLKGATIGIIEGKSTKDQVKQNISKAKVTTFATTDDAVYALKNGKINALVADTTTSEQILDADATLVKLREPLVDRAYLAATYMPTLNPNDDFTLEVGATITRLKSDNSYNTLYEKYFSADAPKVSDFEYNTGKVEGRTLVVGVCEDNAPFSYQDENGKWIGFDVEIANEVAKTWGATLEIRSYPRTKILNAVNTGELKLAFGRFTEHDDLEAYTKVLFSLPYYDASQEILLTENDLAENPLKAQFE